MFPTEMPYRPSAPNFNASLWARWDQLLLGDEATRPTPEQGAERTHCLADAHYFINIYCKIAADTGLGVVPFTLFPYQTDLLTSFLTGQDQIILKARQLGVSELLAAYAVWRTHQPHTTVLIISQGQPEADEFVRRARLIWTHLPSWLRPALRDPRKISTLEFTNGSRLLPFPATEGAGRSFTAQLLILDEWAHQHYQAEIYTAAAPIIKSSGGQILGVSTANGSGNFYHRQWEKGQEGLGMRPTFLPWHARPGRDAAWYAHAAATMEDWQLAQEFPATAEEAFILSGRPRFDLAALNALTAACVEPLKTLRLGTQSDGKPAGFVRYWEPPRPRARYVCGADTAEGLPKGDYSAAVVLDYETGVEVAELHGHWPPEVFATHLAKLCTMYQHAYLGVERNNHGHAVLLALGKLEHYSPLYHHREYDKVTGAAPVAGWQTSTKSKPIMIDALAAVIRERRPYRNRLFLAEARVYTITDTGDTEASGNLHDDRVVAYAIAEQVRKRPHPATAITVDPGIVGKSKWR